MNVYASKLSRLLGQEVKRENDVKKRRSRTLVDIMKKR